MKHIIALLIFTVAMGAAYGQTLKTVSYYDNTQKLNGLALVQSKQQAGVLILPAWKGIDQEAKDVAMELHKQGYAVFIADIYGEGNIPQDNEAAAKIAGQYKSDYKAYQRRIELAMEAFVKEGADAGKIAVIGYCFGGTGALEAARADACDRCGEHSWRPVKKRGPSKRSY